ncbi:MAG: hypothetical protein GPJ54_11960 [Candidatus Heimdallarchaeota archaeon]|nr:hypothetical protein [Candidatus Heimdallarchaeota archaeon]
MPKILLIDNDEKFQAKLKESFENLDNEVSTALPGDEGIKKYKDDGPDLVLLNYGHCRDSADMMFSEILRFDSTACIVTLLNEDVLDQVHRMYLKGARSTIKVPKELKTKKDVKMVMDQMFAICDDLKFDNCVGCWKKGTFTSTIKFN